MSERAARAFVAAAGGVFLLVFLAAAWLWSARGPEILLAISALVCA